MEFQELESLRRFLVEIDSHQIDSLRQYYDTDSHGFYHRHDVRKPGNFSKSSTATCVLSIVATDRWKDGPWSDGAAALAKDMLESEWTSAKLRPNNVFTVGFILEAATVLAGIASGIETNADLAKRINEAEMILLDGLKEEGAARVQEYPASAFVTQLAVRALSGRGSLPKDIASKVSDWAWREIDHQLALQGANSKLADVFSLAYSIILVAKLGDPANATPDESLILRTALHQLFERQLPDGSWPRSRPLFHYPGVGSAYCYEYEMLAQLLQEPGLEELLLRYLPKLREAAYSLRDISYKLESNSLAWSSMHHPQVRGPESWSTASVYHFVHVLGRLVAEGIRRSLFAFLDTPYSPPQDAKTSEQEFAPGFLDCEIKLDNGPQSLKKLLFERFVKPLAAGANDIKHGRPLPPATPMSAILFGPPGTSKTELALHIAKYLQWPLLVVNPSYFVRNGMDRVQAEADRLFSMLEVAERIVVLLDEFDEMVRDRERADEVLSRFLTTSMLPKLANINKNRRIVFIVATNYINRFDLAISRPGRFDLILQVMPPTAEEKLKKWPEVKSKLEEMHIPIAGETKDRMAALTFDEFRALTLKLGSVRQNEEALQALALAYRDCSLRSVINPEQEEQENRTWEDACGMQEKKIRIP